MSGPGEALRGSARIHAAFLRSQAGPGPERAAAAILDLGFEGIALAAPLHEATWEALRAALPRSAISAIEVFLPWPRAVRPGSDPPFHIAALHPEERRDSTRQAIETVLAAERGSIPHVIVPPMRMGALAEPSFPPRDPDRETRIARLRGERERAAKPRLDSLLGLLSKVLSVADRYGVTVALAPGGHPDEIPSPEEAAACLDEFRGGPLRIWMDTGSRALARSFAPLGFDPFAAVEKEAPAGATLRDLGPGGPVPWARGIVDWDTEKPLLERCPVWAVDAPGGDAASLEEAREFIARLEMPEGKAPGGILGI